MPTHVLVSGDFAPTGGMDRANFELARYLAEDVGASVHLVSHRVASPLREHPTVRWHRVPKPLNRYTLGAPLLAAHGRRVAASVAESGARVLVNGGNCAWPDVNWVHAVHAVWPTRAAAAPVAFRARAAWAKRAARRAERRALAMARVVIANSERTRRDVLAVVPGAAERVHTVYLGTDPDAFRPLDAGDAVRARERLAVPVSGPIVTFIGALGHDRNKGFDVLFDAWRTLCAEPAWDAHLLVAGAGAEVELWRQRSRCAGLDGRVHLLGFTSEPATVLAASDVLVSPTHYDGYGLAVHEALCRGIPAFVTDAAGVAERYPPELGDLVWAAPAHAGDVVRGLRAWRADVASYRDRIRPFADRLRRRHWRDMARDIVELIEARVPAESRP